MTKQEIIKELVKRTDLTTSQATDGVIDIITDALVREAPSCCVALRQSKRCGVPPKAARDKQKGTTITIPAYKSVKFTAYKALKARLNSKK